MLLIDYLITVIENLVIEHIVIESIVIENIVIDWLVIESFVIEFICASLMRHLLFIVIGACDESVFTRILGHSIQMHTGIMGVIVNSSIKGNTKHKQNTRLERGYG